MSITIYRFSNIRYFNRQACLICFGRCKINTTFFSARYGRIRVNSRRIITRRLTTITSAINRFLPTVPIVLTRTIFSEISKVLISWFFRVIGLFFNYTFLSLFTFGFNMIMSSIVVRFEEDAIRNGRCILTQFVSNDLSDNGSEVRNVFHALRVEDGASFVTCYYTRTAIF